MTARKGGRAAPWRRTHANLAIRAGDVIDATMVVIPLDTSSTPLPSPQAARRANRGSAASAPIPGTMSTAIPARALRLTRADGDRPSADRLPRLVPQPGQNTSSHGVPAISAARIVGDRNMSRLATSCSFQRSMTAFASARAAASATCCLAPMAMSRPRVRTPIEHYRRNRAEPPPPEPRAAELAGAASTRDADWCAIRGEPTALSGTILVSGARFAVGSAPSRPKLELIQAFPADVGRLRPGGYSGLLGIVGSARC